MPPRLPVFRTVWSVTTAAVLAVALAHLAAQTPGQPTPGAGGPVTPGAGGPGPAGPGPVPGPGGGGFASPGADTPRVDATVATISLGALPPGIGAQGLALSADRALLYVGQGTATTRWDGNQCSGTAPSQSRSPAGSVGVIDTSALLKLTDLPLRAGYPIHVELDSASGRVYVAASPYGLYAFEGLRETGALSLGGAPHDVGIDPGNARGIATNTHDVTGRPEAQTYLTLVDLPTMQIVRPIESGGRGPHKATVDPERHLVFVTHAEYPNLDVVDTATGQVLRQIATGLETGGAQNAIDLVRRRLFTAGQSGTSAAVVRIDLDTEQVSDTPVRLPFGGHGMRVDPVTGLLWTVLENQATVSVIDPATMTETVRVPVGHCPYYLDIDPVRRLAFVTNQGDASVSVVDMTLVPGGAAGSAASTDAQTLAALDRLSASVRRDQHAPVRAVTDAVVDALSPVRIPLAHSVRERLSHTEGLFREHQQRPVTAASTARAANTLAGRLGLAHWAAVTEADVQATRRRLGQPLPHLFGAGAQGGDMSPLEATAVALALAREQLAELGPALANLRPTATRLLQTDSSDASWLAHAFLTDLGLRR